MIKSKLVRIPEDVLKEMNIIKIQTGVKSDSEALRIMIKRIKW